MSAFILTELLVLFIIIILLIILSGVWPLDSPWAPWWQMPDKVIRAIGKIEKISSKDMIYDLGCGTGKALLYMATTYGAKGVGIEIDPIRFYLAKWNLTRVSKQTTRKIDITLLKKNFFDVDISKATIIFVYLVPAALKRLTPKFLKELRPGTKFVSYVYPMPVELFKGKLQLVQHDKESKLFLYKLVK